MSSDDPAAPRGNELARLLEHVPAILSYWDASQHCRFANSAAARWWGLPAESIVGKHASEVLGPLYTLNLPHIEQVLRGEPQQFEREVSDPNGEPARHILVSYTPDVDDD